MKLTILGTGNAAVTECYNTCFLLTEGSDHLLVDAGGGNGIFRQLKAAGVRWQDIRSIFVTHKHLDHITGILWLIRMILQGMARGQYEGEATIYSHKEVTGLLRTLTGLLLSEKETRFLDERLHLVTVENGESLPLLGQTVTFFDIGSTKAAQFGFSITLPGGGKLTCCGDDRSTRRSAPLPGAAAGCSTRPSALQARRMCSSPIKSTTPPWRTPAGWPRNWGRRTSSSTTPRTKTSPGARPSTPPRARPSFPAICSCRRTWRPLNCDKKPAGDALTSPAGFFICILPQCGRWSPACRSSAAQAAPEKAASSQGPPGSQ